MCIGIYRLRLDEGIWSGFRVVRLTVPLQGVSCIGLFRQTQGFESRSYICFVLLWVSTIVRHLLLGVSKKSEHNLHNLRFEASTCPSGQ